MTKQIYLDYMATTPLDPRVFDVMKNYMLQDGVFGNPSSIIHDYGKEAMRAIEKAAEQVASTVGGEDNAIVWTSGATEANNLALSGAAKFHQRRGRHIITSAIEHKAVLDPCKELETQGFEVTYLKPNFDGSIDIETLKQALRTDTILVSIMMVNNELGTINDVKTIAEIVKANGSLFHMDVAQAVGKVQFALSTIPADLVSLSSHKVYGPKGVGALYIRQQPRVRLSPMIFGGGQQRGLRAGTLPTALIVGMGEAFAIAHTHQREDNHRIKTLRDRLRNALAKLDGVRFNGNIENCVDGIINISIEGVSGESLRLALHELAISSSSACSADSTQPSFVLRALGLSAHLAQSSLRIACGRFTTEEEIDRAADIIVKQVQRLRDMSPTLKKVR